MSLSEAQLKARDGKVTASFVPSLMAGDEPKIMREWQRLVGDPAYQPEDLSEVWAPMFGSYIEPFALDWHQRKTGKALTRRGEVVTHPTLPHVCCTLDAYRADDSTVIDCKAPGSWRKIDEVSAFYVPQLIVQKGCVGAENAALLIVHGGAEPKEEPLSWDAAYEAAVWDRIGAFWECVLSLTPPVSLPQAPAFVPLDRMRKVDMTGNNHWAVLAASWISCKVAAGMFDSATKELKALIEPDVCEAQGHGIIARRDKRGVSIKEARQ